MECEGIKFSLNVVSHSAIQVQMGILPVGRAAAVHTSKPPPISERTARDPRRNLRPDIEGDKQVSKG